MTFRPPGITAKAAATLDALTGGRAFVGVGAGWWEREHAAYGLPFPPARERLDALEAAIETMRALWAPGTKAYDGERVSLPETTCYPRPVGTDPGDRRRHRRAAHPARSPPGSATAATCRPTSSVSTASSPCYVATLDASGAPTTSSRSPCSTCPSSAATATTSGRGSSGSAAAPPRRRTPSARTPARSPQQRDRYAGLAERGVGTVFVGARPTSTGPDDVLARRAA